MIGELSALLTAFLWSVTSLFFANAVVRIGSVQVNVSRQLIALIFLFFTSFILKLQFSLQPIQYLYLFLSGIVGLTFGDSFLFLAYQEIGARLSMLIMSLAPAFSAFLAYIFLDERMSLMGILGISITLLGILVVLSRDDKGQKSKINYIGLFFALLASLGQAAGLILAKKAFNISQVHGIVATIIRLSSSLSLLLPVAMLTKKFKNPIKIFKSDLKAFLFTLGGSIAGPFLGITFSLIAISNTKVGIAATIMATPPIIMLPLEKYFYNTKLNLHSIFEAIVAVLGVAVLFLLN